MFKYKRDSADDEGPRAAQSSLLSIVLKAWSLAALVLFGLAAVGYMMLLDVVREEQRSSDAAYVKQVSQHLDTWLSGYVRSVEVVAQDHALAELLQSGSAADAMARQRELAKALDAPRVLLIVDGMESRRLGQYPQLSYAELDMVLEAKSGRQPLVEVHQPASSGAHFDIIRAVRAHDKIVGYVLVSFDNQPLLTELRRLATKGAKLELRQRLNKNEDKLLVSLGDSRNSGQSPLSYPVAGARWQLFYWAPDTVWQVFGVDWQFTYWITFLEILAVMALMMAVFRRHLEGVLAADAGLFYVFIKDRIKGQWLGKNYTPRLKEFDAQLEKLRSLNLTPQSSLRRVPRKKNLTAKSESGKQGGSGKKQQTTAQKQAEAMALDDSYTHLLGQGEKPEPKREEESFDVLPEPEPAPVQAPAPAKKAPVAPPVAEPKNNVGQASRSIFRAYDIRGVVDKTLTAEVAYDIGRAIGSEAWVRGEQSIVVGRDGRFSGPKLSEALIQGLRDSGRDVIDIGRVPTPIVYFATHYLSTRSGVMVTGSHNPPDYNGFKIVLKGEILSGSAIKSLHSRTANQDFTMGEGTLTTQDIQSDYIARVIADVTVKRPLRVVVDCGNGVAGGVAPVVLRGLGCEVSELYCEVDGHFPNHHPDPSRPENLVDLVEEVRSCKADIGLAFDGDGDRLGVVDSRGNIIWPDQQLMLFAADLLKAQPGGQVIYDVKCSRHLHHQIEEHDGVPLMWKSGHSLMRSKLQETQALLAGEMSGHIFFNDRWYGFDDGLYTAVRLIEILARGNDSSADIFARLPQSLSTPELHVELPEGANFELMERLQERANFQGAELIYLDGIRAEFDGGWGLVRASNTTPSLTLRFEADNEEWLAQIKEIFRDELLALDPTLELPI